MSENDGEGQPAPREGITAQKRRHGLLIGIGSAIAIAALLSACSAPLATQPQDIQGPTPQSSTSRANVGQTEGYNITNESGTILTYQRVAGHVGAPPLQPGGAWLPGQTLNFQLNTGFLGMDQNTGDALFEAYTAGGSGGIDAGNVDIHFFDFGNPSEEPGTAGAYLNPMETAPLVSSSNVAPMSYNGETVTMWANSINKINSSTASTYSVGPTWTFSGVTASQLLASIKSSSDAQCTTPSSSVTNCTLGATTWMFTSS